MLKQNHRALVHLLQRTCQSQNWPQAKQVLHRIIKQKIPQPWSGFACAVFFFEQGQIQEAERQLAYLSVYPPFEELFILQAQIQIKKNRLFLAINALRQALEISPLSLPAMKMLVALLQLVGDRDSSIQLISLLLQPDLFSEEVFQSLSREQQVEFRNWLPALGSLQIVTAFACSNYSNHDLIQMLDTWQKRFTPVRLSKHWRNKPDSKRKLTIAYMSNEWSSGPVNMIYDLLFAHHDREKYRTLALIDYPAVSLPPEGERYFDQVMFIQNWNATYLVQQMQEQGVDILVDLSGHFNVRRLMDLTHSLAPLQVNMGSNPPFTIGSSLFDAMFSDPHLTPEPMARAYQEPVLYLDSFFHWQPPAEKKDLLPPPLLKNGYPTLGACASPNKLTHASLVLWAKTLQAIPDSRLNLRLVCPDHDLARAIRKLFQTYGVHSEQLNIVQEQTEPGLYHFFNQVDLILDSIPYSGAVSTCEALWMGVPVISLQSERGIARSIKKTYIWKHGYAVVKLNLYNVLKAWWPILTIYVNSVGLYGD